MLASKLGFFGIPWRNTPFFDNKAAFQLGINQVMRRTTTELVDTLGRARGTSRIDSEPAGRARPRSHGTRRLVHRPARSDAPDAKRLPGSDPEAARIQRQPGAMPGHVRRARRQSAAVPRPHSPATWAPPRTSCAARSKTPTHGWFDPRADDRFWFAYGQLYAYYGILSAPGRTSPPSSASAT